MDVYYYQPKFVELENKIKIKASQPLSHYIIEMAGGVTPSVTEQHKYYSDEYNGIPFLRVQNIAPDGFKLDDCNYINVETHNGLLKRSKVFEGYLVIKITGVGRMAISTVAPYGFEGNINQHLVSIKTKDFGTSQVIAAYLNSDVGEMLSSRRATGGTRPALDYQALKSIPIVFIPQIVDILNSAYTEKNKKEENALEIVNSINGIIANKIGFEFPKIEDKPTFGIKVSAFENRLDPHFYLPNFKALLDNIRKTNNAQLGDLVEFSRETWNQKDGFSDEFPYIEISEIDLSSGKINNVSYVPIEEAPSRAKMVVRENDIIVSTTRPHRGAISLIEQDKEGFIASTGFAILRRLKTDAISKEYLFYILRTQICLLQMLQRSSGGSYPAITAEELKNIYIPIPSKEIQQEIVKDIKAYIEKAEQLKEEAKTEFENAKKEIENLILS